MQDGRSYFTDLLDVDDQPLNPLTPTQWLLASADVVTFNLSELCFQSCATLLCLVFLLKNGKIGIALSLYSFTYLRLCAHNKPHISCFCHSLEKAK